MVIPDIFAALSGIAICLGKLLFISSSTPKNTKGFKLSDEMNENPLLRY